MPRRRRPNILRPTSDLPSDRRTTSVAPLTARNISRYDGPTARSRAASRVSKDDLDGFHSHTAVAAAFRSRTRWQRAPRERGAHVLARLAAPGCVLAILARRIGHERALRTHRPRFSPHDRHDARELHGRDAHSNHGERPSAWAASAHETR